MFEAAETLQRVAWLAVAGGLVLLALGSLHLLLVYAGLLARRESGWRHWAGRRSFTAALVLLLGAALMQVVAHRGLAGRPEPAPAIAAAPPAGEDSTGDVPAGENEAAEDRAAKNPTEEGRPTVSAAAAAVAFGEALAAREAGQAEDAERAYRQARDAFATLGDARREADALHGLGDMALARKDPVGAERRYLEARRLFAGLGIGIGEANVLVGLASVKAGAGARAEAERLLDEAHTIYLKAVSVRGRANVTLARAGLATDPARARRLYSDAAGLYVRAGMPDWADYARSRAR